MSFQLSLFLVYNILICINGYVHHNNTIISEWTSAEIIDLNLQKSKAIYSTASSGVWILGGILNDGTISNSISFLNFATDDTTIYDDFLDKKSNILPQSIYCTHQCSTTINHNEIAIVSPNTDNDDIIYDVWIFDSSKITITTNSNVSMEIEVKNPCITSDPTDHIIWIIGGMDKNGTILNTIQKYDTQTKEFMLINNTMNIGRMSASCSIMNNKLIVFGGTINNVNDTNTIEYYDFDQEEFVLLSANDSILSKKTHDHRSINIDNIIFNVGGYNSNSYLMDAFVISEDDDFDIFTQTMPNITHLYPIICINPVEKRFFIISGTNALNTMEYSNIMSDIEFETHAPSSSPSFSPTASPTDIYDEIQEKLEDILYSKLFDPSTWSTFTKVVVIIALVLSTISCLAFCQHKCRCNCCGCRGADDVEWWRLFRYSLQVYDLFTDINFSIQLWSEWNNFRQIDANEVEWSEREVTFQTTYYMYASILSLVFLVVPYISNLLFVLCPCGLPSLLSKPTYAEAKMWMIARAKVFSLLVILSGGAFASLTLVNSKMFGISLFTMGLSRRQLLQFADIQVKLSIVLENIPQLCLQLSVIWNRYFNPNIYDGKVMDMVTGMSLVSSAFLIIIGVISTCIIKSQIVDDLEITIEVSANEMNKKVIKKIHSCLGLRNTISRELGLVFGVGQDVIEVPRVNRTREGCKIRLYIAKSDTLRTLNDLQKKTNDIAKVLSLLFRVDVQNISVELVATSTDLVDTVVMLSGNNLAINMDEMRQLSNNTDYCNPRLDEDDELLSNDSNDDKKQQNL